MPGVVEGLGGLGVGVVVEETVEEGESFGVGSAGFPGGGGCGGGEAGGLSSAEADVAVDLVVGLGEGDVVDEQADYAFTFPLGGSRIGP